MSLAEFFEDSEAALVPAGTTYALQRGPPPLSLSLSLSLPRVPAACLPLCPELEKARVSKEAFRGPVSSKWWAKQFTVDSESYHRHQWTPGLTSSLSKGTR